MSSEGSRMIPSFQLLCIPACLYFGDAHHSCFFLPISLYNHYAFSSAFPFTVLTGSPVVSGCGTGLWQATGLHWILDRLSGSPSGSGFEGFVWIDGVRLMDFVWLFSFFLFFPMRFLQVLMTMSCLVGGGVWEVSHHHREWRDQAGARGPLLIITLDHPVYTSRVELRLVHGTASHRIQSMKTPYIGPPWWLNGFLQRSILKPFPLASTNKKPVSVDSLLYPWHRQRPKELWCLDLRCQEQYSGNENHPRPWHPLPLRSHWVSG